MADSTADPSTEVTANPGETTEAGETTITLVDLKTPIIHQIGGTRYKVLPETVASQVKMSDGVDLETRMQTVERVATGSAKVKFADDIAARDALTDVVAGDIVIVADATADETVNAGGARYVKLPDGAGWRKTSEDESMDVVVKWTDIEDAPTSTGADIDLAVAAKHTHNNLDDTLSHLSTDGSGNLLFKGQRINDGKVWVAAVDDLANIPTNLADGGLVILRQG